MPQMDRRTRLLIGIPAALLLGFLAVYGINRALTSDVVGRNVTIAGVPVAGMTTEEAVAGLTFHGDLLVGTQIPVQAAGTLGEVSPLTLGFEPDPEAAVDTAFAVGKGEGFFGNLGSWLRRLSTPQEVPLPVDVDEDVYAAGIHFLDEHLVGDPAFPGDVVLEDGRPVALYPENGTAIVQDEARPLLLEAFVSTSRAPVVLPTADDVPVLDDAAVDAAVAEASLLLEGPVTLGTEDGRELVYYVADLTAAFSVVVDEEAGALIIDLDDGLLRAKVDPLIETLSKAPVDARIVTNRETLQATIIPGENGTSVRTDELEAAVLDAYHQPSRSAPLPLEVSAEPDVTTEYLEGLNITHMVSKFTTYHGCCENRVTNIHIIAEASDDVIVPPGGTFDLNAVAGQRTEDKGYLPAGGIVGGEIDNEIIGGGISQFTTTMYNAVFWGGYEDVDHKPHSYYFSRYPMGVEATLDYFSVPLVWRNDDTDGVLVKTYYSETAVTVELWGNNDGRAIAGHHADNTTSTWVLTEGGSDARIVTGTISEPTDPVEPAEELIPNPEIEPGTRKRVDSGIAGFTVAITRTIEEGGASETLNWTWRYRAKPVRYEVHPCDLPGGPACPPPPTTTTLPPVATTTTVPTEGGGEGEGDGG